MEDDRRWSAESSRLLWRSWDDDEFVVYHVASSNTHVLNAVAAEALRVLKQGPLSCLDLARQVSLSIGGVLDDAFVQRIEQLIAEFDQLGLIEPVS